MKPAELAIFLRSTRERANRSALEIATALGVSVQTVHNWERASNPTRPATERFPDIERAYGLPPGTLGYAVVTPRSDPTLAYWVGRWEQATDHLERVLREQRELVEAMRVPHDARGEPPPPRVSGSRRPRPSRSAE
jgi:transcriptional regulator with XRE-family HTH domain